jgi:hypothetical protein
MDRSCLRRNQIVLLVAGLVLWTPLAHAQTCLEGPVDGFTVRAVKFSSLFGRTSQELQQKLDAHRGEPYSLDTTSRYIAEIDQFLNNDAAQQKYERLFAGELKLAVKGVLTELDCVEPVPPEDCQKALPGQTQCVDVRIKRYSVEINALNSSPFLIPFPQSVATVIYDALPRPLLALNPSFTADADRKFGLSAGLNTATNLLNLPALIRRVEPSPSTAGAVQPGPPAPPAAPDSLEVVPFSPTPASAVEDTADNPEMNDTKLLLRLSGRKSLNKDFYNTSSRLSLEKRNPPLDVYQGFAVATAFEANHLPLGDGEFLRNALKLDFGHDLRPLAGPVKLVNFGVAYRRSSDRFTARRGGTAEAGIENNFEARALADGSLAKGLARAAFWIDRGAPDGGRASYHGVATRFGYGKEFIIPRRREFRKISPPELGGQECWTSYAEDPKNNEPAVGMELLAGFGRASGRVPRYAAFWGGNPTGQFLYDELSAPAMTGFAAGPILRTLGQNQAGIVTGAGLSSSGGTSYWHANLNVSVPVPAWSRPLIPHEWVTVSKMGEGDEAFKGHVPDGANICRDLKHTIKILVGKSGVNLLINQQARDLLTDAQKKDLRLRNKQNPTPEEALRLQAAESALAAAKLQTKAVVEAMFKREILPITDFIADHANMISVKPLLLFDVAHVGLSGLDAPARYGAGAGLQIDVVSARFEFGYLAAINRGLRDPRGNFIGRMVLRNFF